MGANAADLIAAKGIKLRTSIFDGKGASLRVESIPVDEELWLALEKEMLVNGFEKDSRPKSLRSSVGNELVTVGGES